MTMAISIQHSWPLLLLVAIPLLWWAARKTRTNLGRRHLVVISVLRSLAIAMLALALMSPQWHAGSEDVAVVYALDVSRSVSSSFIDSALAWIGEADREGKPAQAPRFPFDPWAALLLASTFLLLFEWWSWNRRVTV